MRDMPKVLEGERVVGEAHLPNLSYRVTVLTYGHLYVCVALSGHEVEDCELDPPEARALGEALIQAAELAAKGSH